MPGGVGGSCSVHEALPSGGEKGQLYLERGTGSAKEFVWFFRMMALVVLSFL